MANRFLSNIRINDAYTFPASDGAEGQVIVTDGAGNLSFADAASGTNAASVIYRDNFIGDGVETQFTMDRSVSVEDQTQIYVDGVYQEKDTYTVVDNLITFDTAPDSGHSIEVISISSINVGPTVIYQDNFTGDGVTTDFTLEHSVSDEVKTMVFLNGVYQFKGTYSVSGSTISFDAAPSDTVDVEVITIESASAETNTQKILFYGKATGAISKGDAVMFAGAQGDHFLFTKATQAAIEANHELFIGLANQDFANNEFGYVVEFGRLDQIDTTVYTSTAGTILWFDSEGTVAGAITETEPTPPAAKIQVAAVIRLHQNEGSLFVRPTWYHELGELHDVSIVSLADKDLLTYNNTTGVWENSKTLGDITTGNITTSGTVDSVDISDFKAAYDSHNHDDRYYTETEIDTFLTNSTNWDTAFSWGDHAGLYSLLGHSHVESDITDFGNYLTGLTHDTVNTKLVVTTRDGLTQDISLTQYLDDTNLARIVSGSVDAGTGIATFNRDDASTFTVDFSSLLDDTNDYVTSAAFNTADGVLTLTRFGGSTVTVDLDGRYLQSFDITTQTDPKYLRSDANDTYTGILTFGNNDTKIYGADNFPLVQVNAGRAYFGSTSRAKTVLASTDTIHHVRGGTEYLIWTEYNDGSGSGLDADTLDGIQGSSFLRSDTADTMNGLLTALGGIDMNNASIINVGGITINDPGVGEGIQWNGGNGWQIYESPDAMTNAAGNLQFTTGTTFKFRVDTSGNTFSAGSSRSPIFYDSNNTAYYINPTGNSVLGPKTTIVNENGNVAALALSENILEEHVRLEYDGTGTGATNYFHIYSGLSTWAPKGSSFNMQPSTGDINIGGLNFGYKFRVDGTTLLLDDNPLTLYSATNGNGVKIKFSDNASGGYGQNATMEYVHTNTQSYGSGHAFKFYGTESTMSFHVAGTGLFTGDVTAYYSDMRLKTKLGSIENPIEKIKALNGFYYEPNEVAQSYGYQKEKRVGLSAQEIEAVLPEIVTDAPIGDGYKAVDYAKLVPVLVEAIKELSNKVEELENKLNG